jgi:hypothetical protein
LITGGLAGPLLMNPDSATWHSFRTKHVIGDPATDLVEWGVASVYSR